MRQAIVTKYLGPTNHRGSRVKAIADAGEITIPWDDALDVQANHLKAATVLLHKFGWNESPSFLRLEGGSLPQSSDYAYCFVLLQREPLVSTLRR